MKKLILNRLLDEEANIKKSINDIRSGDLSQTQSNLEEQLLKI